MSSYDTLIEQLPSYFRPIIEFQEILKAHGYAMDSLDSSAEQVYNNNYIQTADVQTIAFWENALGITYTYGDTLDFRRTRILQKFRLSTNFPIGALTDNLTQLFGEDGYEMNLDYENLTISIKVTSDRYGAIDLLYNLLWDVIPAHIQIIANQETVNYVGPSKLYAAAINANTQVQTIPADNYENIQGTMASTGILSITSQQYIGGK